MKQKERLGKGRSFDYEKCTFPHEELEAWQLQMKVLRDLGVPPTNLELLAIERLKLSHDPKVLQEAVRLMKQRDPSAAFTQ